MGLLKSNLKRAAELILGQKAHMLCVGDSQSMSIMPRMWSLWPMYHRAYYHYFVAGSSSNSEGNFFNHVGFGGTSNIVGTARPVTGYGALTTAEQFLRPVTYSVLPAIADGALSGSGNYLVRQCLGGLDGSVRSAQGAPWPTFPNNSGEPWYHNTYLKATMLRHIHIGEVGNISGTMLRSGENGAGNNWSQLNSSVALSVVSGPNGYINRTGWTTALTDGGSYDVVGGGQTGIFNDHDVYWRLQGAAGVTELSATIIPVAFVYARCNSGGTIPWNADNTGCGFDFFGVGGAYADDWANNWANQNCWQDYFAHTVHVPNGAVVQVFMLGHNLTNSGTTGATTTEYSGSTLQAAFENNYISFINKCKAAHAAQFPGCEYVPVVIMPWRSGESGTGTYNLADAVQVQAACERVAAATGAGFFSLFEYFDQLAPFTRLHPMSLNDGHMLCQAFRDVLDRETLYQYSDVGAFGGNATRLMRG